MDLCQPNCWDYFFAFVLQWTEFTWKDIHKCWYIQHMTFLFICISFMSILSGSNRWIHICFCNHSHLLFHRYLQLAHAIELNDLEQFTTYREALAGVNVADMDLVLPEAFPQLRFRPLTFQCLPRGQEEMAILLLESGASKDGVHEVGGVDIIEDHDDIMTWWHFLHYWPFVPGNHIWPVVYKGPENGKYFYVMSSMLCYHDTDALFEKGRRNALYL